MDGATKRTSSSIRGTKTKGRKVTEFERILLKGESGVSVGGSGSNPGRLTRSSASASSSLPSSGEEGIVTRGRRGSSLSLPHVPGTRDLHELTISYVNEPRNNGHSDSNNNNKDKRLKDESGSKSLWESGDKDDEVSQAETQVSSTPPKLKPITIYVGGPNSQGQKATTLDLSPPSLFNKIKVGVSKLSSSQGPAPLQASEGSDEVRKINSSGWSGGESNSSMAPQVLMNNLPYMGELTFDTRPRRGRKPKKADICHLISKNYGIQFPHAYVNEPNSTMSSNPNGPHDLEGEGLRSLISSKDFSPYQSSLHDVSPNLRRAPGRPIINSSSPPQFGTSRGTGRKSWTSRSHNPHSIPPDLLPLNALLHSTLSVGSGLRSSDPIINPAAFLSQSLQISEDSPDLSFSPTPGSRSKGSRNPSQKVNPTSKTREGLEPSRDEPLNLCMRDKEDEEGLGLNVLESPRTPGFPLPSHDLLSRFNQQSQYPKSRPRRGALTRNSSSDPKTRDSNYLVNLLGRSPGRPSSRATPDQNYSPQNHHPLLFSPSQNHSSTTTSCSSISHCPSNSSALCSTPASSPMMMTHGGQGHTLDHLDLSPTPDNSTRSRRKRKAPEQGGPHRGRRRGPGGGTGGPRHGHGSPSTVSAATAAAAAAAVAASNSAQVSICKFKFTGGAKPSLQEKKMLSVDSGGNFRFFSDKPCTSTSSAGLKAHHHSSTLFGAGGQVGELINPTLPHQTTKPYLPTYYPDWEGNNNGSSVSSLPKSAKSMSNCMVSTTGSGGPGSSSSPNSHFGPLPNLSNSRFSIPTSPFTPENLHMTLDASTSPGVSEDSMSSQEEEEDEAGVQGYHGHGSMVSMGVLDGDDDDGGGGNSQYKAGSRRKRRTRKSLMREKLEKTFKEKGFLIQTQQLESAEGATYCKFRQLRKFTRYLFRSWKDYLPENVKAISGGVGGEGEEVGMRSQMEDHPEDPDGEEGSIEEDIGVEAHDDFPHHVEEDTDEVGVEDEEALGSLEDHDP